MNRAEQFLETDLCVKCGLCLPHCPTYRLSEDENESPRGRLALIQGWSTGVLDASENLRGHLDHCLMCRACEKVCPAKVPYGKLVDNFRNVTAPMAQQKGSQVERLLENRLNRRLLGAFLIAYKRCGLDWLLRCCGLLKLLRLDKLDSMLPEPMSLNPLDSSPANDGDDIALFVGCTGELFDRQTVNAAASVLRYLGFRVKAPEGQTCCGALALHRGDQSLASQLVLENAEVFGRASQVVTLASGCGATLREQGERFGEMEGSRELSDKVCDINRFIVQHWPDQSKLRRLDLKVFIHTPCSLKNVMNMADSPVQLLSKIPGVQILEDESAQFCCGASGNRFLTDPETAASLTGPLLDQVERFQPDYLVSSNVGCALNLRAALAERGLEVKVSHPVAILEQALP